jgi:copper(I)-binding protein
MLIDLKHPLKPGDSVNLTLRFDNGKQANAAKGITVPVKAAP